NATGTTTVNITANGTGDITQSAGTIAGGVLTLASGTGNIGSSGNALDTAATSLSANSGGTSDIFISEADSVSIGASASGDELSIQANGTMTTTGIITADDVTLTSGNNGDVSL